MHMECSTKALFCRLRISAISRKYFEIAFIFHAFVYNCLSLIWYFQPIHKATFWSILSAQVRYMYACFWRLVFYIGSLLNKCHSTCDECYWTICKSSSHLALFGCSAGQSCGDALLSYHQSIQVL